MLGQSAIGAAALGSPGGKASPVSSPTNVNASQSRLLTVVRSSANAARASALRLLSVIKSSALKMQTPAVRLIAVTKATPPLTISNTRLLAVVGGRVDNHKVRAFPMRLDGHEFYVLRVGESATLVYDLLTGQWSQWSSEDFTKVWRPNVGTNWTGMGKAFYDVGANSDIILGDDTFGVLWVVDPAKGYDDNPTIGLGGLPFKRRVVGGVAQRLRTTTKVGAAYLTADVGNSQLTLGTAATITLRTSDDYGKTWVNQGDVTVTPGDYSQEFVWRSIGLIKAPGRIFEITDNGATVRIDSLDMR